MVEIIHRNITVSGKVQGVWFRKFTQERAAILGVQGWVRNTQEGNVYIEAEAESSVMEIFLESVKQGSPLSQVQNMVVEEAPVKYFIAFEILYT